MSHQVDRKWEAAAMPGSGDVVVRPAGGGLRTVTRAEAAVIADAVIAWRQSSASTAQEAGRADDHS